MSNAAALPPAPLVKATHLARVFHDGKAELHVLRDVSFEVRAQEVVALVGKSGSGKSTLLHILGLLDAPTGGELLVDGTPTATLSERGRSRIRARHVGFIFQHYHLFQEFSVFENLLLPVQVEQSVLGWLGSRGETKSRAEKLLEDVGLKERRRARPKTLSGGERQRVAIARALMNRPKLLLCDEPTGNLDPHTGTRIMDLLFELSRKDGVGMAVVTHDVQLARRADRVLRLEDGVLKAETPATTGTSA